MSNELNQSKQQLEQILMRTRALIQKKTAELKQFLREHNSAAHPISSENRQHATRMLGHIKVLKEKANRLVSLIKPLSQLAQPVQPAPQEAESKGPIQRVIGLLKPLNGDPIQPIKGLARIVTNPATLIVVAVRVAVRIVAKIASKIFPNLFGSQENVSHENAATSAPKASQSFVSQPEPHTHDCAAAPKTKVRVVVFPSVPKTKPEASNSHVPKGPKGGSGGSGLLTTAAKIKEGQDYLAVERTAAALLDDAENSVNASQGREFAQLGQQMGQFQHETTKASADALQAARSLQADMPKGMLSTIAASTAKLAETSEQVAVINEQRSVKYR